VAEIDRSPRPWSPALRGFLRFRVGDEDIQPLAAMERTLLCTRIGPAGSRRSALNRISGAPPSPRIAATEIPRLATSVGMNPNAGRHFRQR